MTEETSAAMDAARAHPDFDEKVCTHNRVRVRVRALKHRHTLTQPNEHTCVWEHRHTMRNSSFPYHAKLNFDGVVRPLSTPPPSRLPSPSHNIRLR